jgi:hypothetical protein
MLTQGAGVVWAGLSASGVSDSFSIGAGATALEVASDVISIDASDTFTVYADIQDSDGNWIQAAALPAQTTAGIQTVLVPSLAAVTSNFVSVARLRWTTVSGGGIVALLVAVGR